MAKRTLQEQIDRIKFINKYVINETPKYKSLVGGTGSDQLPEYLMKEADAEAEAAPTGPTPEELPNSTAPATPAAPADPAATPATPAPTGATPTTPAPAAETPLPEPQVMPAPVPAPPVESPEKKVAELQLAALTKMSAKIDDLGAAIDSINGRMEVMGDEVDEVREPSDMEKFDNRKVDSSPYYFNLNDLWKDNNFKSRMDQFSKGYVKTEDGYVADFDDLPKLSPHEVKASFDPNF